MTTKGTVKEIKVTATGNIVTLTVTNPPPPPDTEDFTDAPDWALRQFQTALAGDMTVEVVHEGNTVGSVKVLS